MVSGFPAIKGAIHCIAAPDAQSCVGSWCIAKSLKKRILGPLKASEGGKGMINLSMEVLRQKKAHLDRLYYEMNNQRDFYLAIMTRKDGLTKCSKWRPYSVICFPINHDGTAEDSRAQWFFSRVNNRTILPCEVVLDGESMDSYQAVIELLNLKGWGYYAYETGSRGFHVHIRFASRN